jgi:hypothetical protein
MWAVQKSIYNALASSSSFMAKISNALYDEPPTNSPYPYVTIGSMTETTSNRLNNSKGYIVTLELRIFTDTGRGGYKLSKEILELANTAINLKSFGIDGFNMVQCYYTYSSTERDADKRIINANYDIICH